MAKTTIDVGTRAFRRQSPQGQIKRLKRQRNLLLIPWALLLAPVAVPWWMWRRRAASRSGVPVAARLTNEKVDQMARYLWIGAPAQATAALSRLAEDPQSPVPVRVMALCQLADRFDFDGRSDAAVQALATAESLVPDGPGAWDWAARAAFLALRSGNFDRARQKLVLTGDRADDPSAILLRASAERDEAARLEGFNTLFRAHGLAPLRKADPALPLSLTNLATDPVTPAPTRGHVTVIMPAWNAAATIAAALRSVLAQSHADLSVIVVDDASTDRTADVVAQIAAADTRVRLLRQPRNMGPYAARNRALAEARGDFITTHDADDWSHPQRIARQVSVLESRPEVVGVLSDWVRTTPDLRVTPGWRLGANPFSPNFSSFLVRAAVAAELGCWDDVRFGADSEFVSRTARRFGPDAVIVADPNIPGAFGLDSPASLSRAGPSHVSSFLYGLRQLHAELSRALHDRGQFGHDALAIKAAVLPPAILTGDSVPSRPIDRVLIGDCRNPAAVARMLAITDAPDPRASMTGILHRPDFVVGATDAPVSVVPGDPFCAEWLDLVLRPGVRAVIADEVQDVPQRTELIVLDPAAADPPRFPA
jgi:hypothetical protein